MSLLFFLKPHFVPIRAKEEDYIQSAYAKEPKKKKRVKKAPQLPPEVVNYVNKARREADQEALAKKQLLKLLEDQEQLAVEIQARVWKRIQEEQALRAAEQQRLAELAAANQLQLQIIEDYILAVKKRRQKEEREILALIHLHVL